METYISMKIWIDADACPRGDIYTEDNVGDRLSMRNLMQDLRMGGLVSGGPA
jgi:uncharacterized protein YaiI (UPF0178 family)